ncbi:hypothetical protein ACFWNN_03500 [Lentzea sp. NPDC058450]|uniref:hypothetical protein n=1 Tax=Lentzea sp. NPDC058450 TaxID=3346505 RepID=UPI00365A01BA
MDESNPASLEQGQRKLLVSLSNAKLGFLLSILIILAAIAFAVSFLLSRQSGAWFSFSSGLVKLVADASLSAAVVGFAYEWLVRREAADNLRLMYKTSLQQHQKAVVNTVMREIPRALLLDKKVQNSVFFGGTKIEEIIQGALNAKLGDEEMGGSIYEGLLQKTFSYTERYIGLRVEVMLSNVDESEPVNVQEKFYDAVVTLRYKTKLKSSRFIFARALDHDQFNLRVNHNDYIFTWRLEETPGLPKDSNRALDLYRFAIDNVELAKVPRVTEDGAYEIVCEDPSLESKIGTEVTIHYAIMTKLARLDHVFFYTAVRPTRGVTVIFNYARTDIENVLTYDFFVSAKSPVVYQLPRERPHTVVVELDEWVFPKGGVAFVWRLKGESTEEDRPGPTNAKESTTSKVDNPDSSPTSSNRKLP